jgi:hypothetical protein
MKYDATLNTVFLVSRTYIMNSYTIFAMLPLAMLPRVLTMCPLIMWYLNFHVRYKINSKQMHRRTEGWCLQFVRNKRSISALRRSVTQTATCSSVRWILMPLLQVSQWGSFSYQSTPETSLSWSSNTSSWEYTIIAHLNSWGSSRKHSPWRKIAICMLNIVRIIKKSRNFMLLLSY